MYLFLLELLFTAQDVLESSVTLDLIYVIVNDKTVFILLTT